MNRDFDNGKPIKMSSRSMIPYEQPNSLATIFLEKYDGDKERSRLNEEIQKKMNMDTQDPDYHALKAVENAFCDQDDHRKKMCFFREEREGRQSIGLGKYQYAYVDPLSGQVHIVIHKYAMLRKKEGQQTLEQAFISERQQLKNCITEIYAKPIWRTEQGTIAKQFRKERDQTDRTPYLVQEVESHVITKIPFVLEKSVEQDPTVAELIRLKDVDAKLMDILLFKVPKQEWSTVTADPNVKDEIRNDIRNNDPSRAQTTRSRTKRRRTAEKTAEEGIKEIRQGGVGLRRQKKKARRDDKEARGRENSGIRIDTAK